VNEKILQAARTEFARKGYHRTVVSAVADRAGVGKGTVYRRFGDKKCLFTSLIRHGICDLEQSLEAAFDPEAEPVANLQAVLETFFGLYDDSRELIEIILTEGTQLIGMAREELKDELEAIYGQIARVFAQGMAWKRFRPFDPQELAFLLHRFIMSVLESGAFYDYDPREKYGSMLMDILLNGIQTREVTP
jgi:AcrR family transcriptional regulator